MAKLQELLEEIRTIEEKISEEIGREAKQLGYSVQRGKVIFEREVVNRHKILAKKIGQYFSECSLLDLLAAPIVYSLIIPVVIFDIFVWVYQTICFPVYGLPKVRRRDYIVFDRHLLKFLNPVERFNCVYCSYANGFIAYVQEVAARSEQYWCPIKHARHLSGTHARYQNFVNYGDAEEYQNRVDELRKELTD